MDIVRWDWRELDHPEADTREPCTRASPRGLGSHARRRSTSTTEVSHNLQWHAYGKPQGLGVKGFSYEVCADEAWAVCAAWASRREGTRRGSSGGMTDLERTEALGSSWTPLRGMLDLRRVCVNEKRRERVADDRRTLPEPPLPPRGRGRSPPSGGGTPESPGRSPRPAPQGRKSRPKAEFAANSTQTAGGPWT